MNTESELIRCNKEFAEIIKRQQAALQIVSMLEFEKEPSMVSHLRDAVYAFYRPALERNSIEQSLLEKLQAHKEG